MAEEGFIPGTEQHDICKRALGFSNFTYRQSEELEEGTSVDCSTLTSQSYWEGALIGIPFIADSQRQAKSGTAVGSMEELIPGDVLVKYPSVDESPDKKWNHVGLYLGRDVAGGQWLIESTGKTGVRISRVEEFDPQGGIKRFTLTREVIHSLRAQMALFLAPLVPKFGRLGVRQYRRTSPDRPPHKGLDIYVSEGAHVYATMAGRAMFSSDPVEHSSGVEIVGDRFIVRYLMLGDIAVQAGTFVRDGDIIGRTIPPSEESDIVYSSANVTPSHLHLEVELAIPTSGNIGNRAVIDGREYLNHLYLSKLGMLSLPIRL
jgi:Peptidase family M23/NlpC/P60 family